MRLLTRFVSGLLLFLIAASAGAQFAQYTTPGGPDGRPVDRKGLLRKQVESARFRLGAVRVAPAFGLKDAEYVRNLLGARSGSGTPTDFTATVGAGARAYLPTGPAVTWTLYALPEYVWWQHDTARRRLNGLYGVGFDGFWNRLTVTAAAGSDTQQQILTSELPRLTSARVDHAGGTAEIEVSGPIYTFVSGTASRSRNLGKPSVDPFADLLDQLDRDEQVARAELRWRHRGWLAGLGAEYSNVDFIRRPGVIDRSNSGTAPVLELTRDGGRLFFQADVAQRSLTAKQGSSFVKFDKTTGNAAVSYEMTRAAGLWVYFNRNLVYSLSTGYSYLADLRHGVALHMKLGPRTSANLFGETGTLDYTAIAAGTPRRKDDLVSFGGAVNFRLLRSATLGIQGSRTRFNSNIAGASRELTVLGLTATFVGGQP